jgi:[glutamine synthetase] adenylyltransferase / [glutamine synthetase]-adenylyl-L-tyrosine phosphorylase
MNSTRQLFEVALQKIPPERRGPVEHAWREFHEQSPASLQQSAPDWIAEVPRVFAASDFAAQLGARHPHVLRELVESGDLFRAGGTGDLTRRVQRAVDGAVDEAELKTRLRVQRRREMLRIAWRDLAGHADLAEVTAALSELADACTDAALARLHALACAKYGQPVGERSGAPQQLVVLGMGKLGGYELNFSSDIDLIFAYPEDNEPAAPAALSNHEFFVRLGQALIAALSDKTADGFVFRVDMRLRPNGASGPLALSFDAMEHYYQTHGREWERYAFIKARVIAGDRSAGAELLARLKPFVFRKYLDFSAIEAIRTMKAMIAREVERKGLRDNVKLGPGGIREIEFFAQALQLVRGGREPQLQEPALLRVLPHLAAGGHIPAAQARALADAYVFLRNTEHRLQMVDDRQTQLLPADTGERARLAFASGFADWTAFERELNRHRAAVQEAFTQLFAAAPQETETGAHPGLAAVWLQGVEQDAAQRLLAEAGYPDADTALVLLEGLRSGGAYESFSAEGRARMDRLVPLLLAEAARTPEPLTTLTRIVNLLEAIGRRTTYLALLIENPMALTQLVALCAASPWIAAWIGRHPILLDELLDPRALYAPLTKEGLADELQSRLAHIPAEDEELQMEILREFRHGHVLHVAAADIAGRGDIEAEHVGRTLAWIAETVIAESLALCRERLAGRHGRPRCPGSDAESGFCVVGYGKLGSLELGYASDLDIIFIYEGCDEGMTDGERPVPNETYFARLGQRLIHVLTTRTAGGILYEVDMRLRPSGKSGPLVSSLAAYRKYQLTEAWTWEHQALVRARPVAGNERVRADFARIREEILCLPREPEKLAGDVVEMRKRMAESHPGAKDPARFDLKHDRGGIVDIEFMVQYAVLRWSAEHPVLTAHTDNIPILQALAAAGLMGRGEVETLIGAYRKYLSMEHRTKLMERGSTVDRAELGNLPERVRGVWEGVFGKSG